MNIQSRRYVYFVRGIHRRPMDFSYNGLVMQKAFPWYDVTTDGVLG